LPFIPIVLGLSYGFKSGIRINPSGPSHLIHPHGSINATVGDVPTTTRFNLGNCLEESGIVHGGQRGEGVGGKGKDKGKVSHRV
jgi:hypothetical protein